MKRLPPLHPLLAAAAPVLFLGAHNADQIELSALTPVLAASLTFAAIGTGLCWALLRDRTKGGLLATLCILLFFLYGRLFDVLWEREWFSASAHVYLALTVASSVIAGSALLLLWRTRSTLETLSRATTLFTTLMFASSAWELGKAAHEAQAPPPAKTSDARSVPPVLEERPDKPDIYYIILDGYARLDTLKEFYRYDNRAFYQELRRRGFYVADQSRSNYMMTHLCLASILEMRYLDEDFKKVGPKSSNKLHFYKAIYRNAAGRHLRDEGYRYVHFDTMFGGTETSEVADIRYNVRPAWMRSEFMTVMVRTTMLRALEPSMAQSIRSMTREVMEIPKMEGPTFTFLHLLIPHNPYVFDRDGNERANIPVTLQFEEKTGGWSGKKEYVDQLVYASRRILEVVDAIIANSPQPPIIILQSDHGSASSYRSRQPQKKRERFYRERTGILNAWYAPEAVKAQLTRDMAPVNTFRVLFSTLFGDPLPSLPTHNYASWYGRPNSQREITSFLQGYDAKKAATAATPSPPPVRSSAPATSP